MRLSPTTADAREDADLAVDHVGQASNLESLNRVFDTRRADLQSAVSQVCNLRIVRNLERPWVNRSRADYKYAIRQIKNLRYVDQIPRKSWISCPARNVRFDCRSTRVFWKAGQGRRLPDFDP
jgi:hypothetical protein